MLSRILRNSVRRFSGSDPYWTHLEQQHDNYPQYAHLHWTTMDVLEIGKYAKLRKEKFSDHISEDPHEIDVLPFSSECTTVNPRIRDEVYEFFMQNDNRFKSYMHDEKVLGEEITRAESFKQYVLEIVKPKQIEDAIGFAKSLIEEYKSLGLPFTSEAVKTRTFAFLFDSLSKHQTEEILHAAEPFLDRYGIGMPMNLD
mmetsp:Transcript_5819/g.10372  ORF Transcript_5819/g.10372 Transcript_5819/m.10372 type:complete len:199 (+) Transcript_5819:1355-1951(+)